MELTKTNPKQILDSLQMRFGCLQTDEGIPIRSSLANLCRYTASYLCPITKRGLIKAITTPFENMGQNNLSLEIKNIISTLISHGDLLELEDNTDELTQVPQTLIYLAPPQFVPIAVNQVVLLGIAPDDIPILPDDFEHEIQQRDCLRVIVSENAANLSESLENHGLYQLSSDTWLRSPSAKSEIAYIEHFKRYLDKSNQPGENITIEILDTEKSVTYYRGRWRAPSDDTTGCFVAKRQGFYGETIWCYIELENGVATNLLDLPHGRTSERGCDQAWRLQAAIDSAHRTPQKVRIRGLHNGMVAFDLFSPIPNWLERRWSVVGSPGESKNCLISYFFYPNDIETEMSFAKERLWLEFTELKE